MKPVTAAVARLLIARGPDGLTKAEARAQLHIESLTQRVFELRAIGWDVDTVLEMTGDGTRFARYVCRAIPPEDARLFAPVTVEAVA